MKGIPSEIILLAILLLILQTLWPVILIVAIIVIAIIVYKATKEKKHQKVLAEERKKAEGEREIRKRKSEKISIIKEKCKAFSNIFNRESIQKEEDELRTLLSYNFTSEFEVPFIEIKIKKQQLKIAIVSLALDIIEEIEQNDEVSDLIIKLDQYLQEYETVSGFDGRQISVEQEDDYNHLCKILETLPTKTFVHLSTDSSLNSLNLCYNQKSKYKFERSAYLGVGACLKPIHLSYESKSVYLYPYYIIIVQGEKFEFISWESLAFNRSQIKGYTKGFQSKVIGAEILYSIYEHTRVDGTPDRRYKKNDLYHLIRLYKLHCLSIPILNIIIANHVEMVAVEKAFLKYSSYFQINQQNIYVENSEFTETLNDLQEVIENIISNNGIDILFDKKFINILNDSGIAYRQTSLFELIKRFYQDGIILDIYYSEISEKRIYEIRTEYSSKYNFDPIMVRCILELMHKIIKSFKH